MGCQAKKPLYYISDAIFSDFKEIKMVFSLGKIFFTDEEILLIEHYNAPWSIKIRKNDEMLQYILHHFLTSEKPKMAHLINVIYKLTYMYL